jgi:sugar lactone lactonase YvrE
MRTSQRIFAMVLLLFSGCGNGKLSGDDMGGGGDLAGGGGGDLAGGGGGDLAGGGGGDMAPPGPPGLDVIAGRLGGDGNADRTGTAARFTGAISVAFDGADSVYIGDVTSGTGGRTRKLSLATGELTTLPTSVGPISIIYDGAGTLYGLSGSGNGFAAFCGLIGFGSRVGKLDLASNTFTTIAGNLSSGNTDGTGTAARFNGACGMAFDGAGNLYVADTGNHSIRKIEVATAAVTTLAGSASASGSTDGTGTAARFNRPRGIASDGAGNLYVADSDNHTIRKIEAATGVVTTLAGNPGRQGSLDGTGTAARFTSPVSLTYDGAGNLYIVELSYTVRRLELATGAVTTLAGSPSQFGSADGTGAQARFFSPWGVTSDGAGNVYVADQYALRRVVAATSTVTTISGMAPHAGSTNGVGMAARFTMPIGVAWDGSNTLYVADLANHAIRRMNTMTGEVTTLAGSPGTPGGNVDGTGAEARFIGPFGLTYDRGDLYVSEATAFTIRKVVAATGVVTTVAGAANVQGGADGTGTAARFYLPTGVAADGAGNVWVADASGCTIRRIVLATSDVTTFAGAARACNRVDGIGTAARFSGPYDIACDGAGNLYIAELSAIRKLVIATGAVTTLAGGTGGAIVDGIGTAARFQEVRGLTHDGAGNLYIVDGTTVRKLVLSTTAVSTVLGVPGPRGVLLGAFPGGLNQPQRVAFIRNQGLVLSDGIENAILFARGL